MGLKKIERKKRYGVKRLFQSFHYAFEGILYTLFNEQNFFIHLIIGTLVIILGFLFHINTVEWLFLVVMIGLVLTAELINTSIEAIVDLISLEEHPLAKIAKDTASAAVLTFALTSVVVGFIIFLPKIIEVIL